MDPQNFSFFEFIGTVTFYKKYDKAPIYTRSQIIEDLLAGTSSNNKLHHQAIVGLLYPHLMDPHSTLKKTILGIDGPVQVNVRVWKFHGYYKIHLEKDPAYQIIGESYWCINRIIDNNDHSFEVHGTYKFISEEPHQYLTLPSFFSFPTRLQKLLALGQTIDDIKISTSINSIHNPSAPNQEEHDSSESLVADSISMVFSPEYRKKNKLGNFTQFFKKSK